MIGLDTNVVVRYIAQDDRIQSRKAAELIEAMTPEEPGFVTMISVVELVWVLQGPYRASKPEIVAVLETLLRTKELIVEQAETVWKALRLFVESQADFADCLIVYCAQAAQCEFTVTFDKKAAKTAGMRLVE